MKKCFFAMLLFLMICLPALADVVIPPDFFRPTPRAVKTATPIPSPSLSPIVAEPSPVTDVDEPSSNVIVEPSIDVIAQPSPEVVEPSPAPESSQEPVSGNFILTVAVVLMAASLGLWMGIRAHKGK